MGEEKKSIKRRILQMVEVGFVEDFQSRLYDYINFFAILLNLIVCILYTFDSVNGPYHGVLYLLETITVIFFALDYVLRLITADLLFPHLSRSKAISRYCLSFTGIIDLISFLPFFLPVVFPAGAVAFRMLRVARIFRLFRINAYYDSLNVISAVLTSKKQQLISSVFIIAVLMVASSLCMYSLEHDAQPEVFANAFSGIWWATSTLLTVGYGDIYPITVAGKALGIVITFLGCGMVAIPTGIISAGFVEQYTRYRELSESMGTNPLHFVKVRLEPGDPWTKCKIKDLIFPTNVIIAVIQRNNEVIAPRGDVELMPGDVIMLGAKDHPGDWKVELQELHIKDLHPWRDRAIKDLDISRQSFIISVQRGSDTIVPSGDTVLKADDRVLLYSKKRILETDKFSV